MLKRNWTRLRQSFRASRSPRESSITKLPVELLRLILELLCTPDEDRKSLLALALTCRTLWVLAREYIPRDVNVNAHSTSTTFTLFERSVTGDSSYARNVQTLIFKTGGKKCDIPKARVRQLFICLSALRVLKLDGLPRSYVVPTLFSGQLELKKTVKRLKIPGGMTIAMVAELTSFPAIRKWRFWSLDDLECYAEFPEVEKIYLGKLVFQRSQVGLPLFENIVSRSQNLKTLETNLPFLPPVVKTDISHEIIIENTFSALRLQTILLHAADTLTSLNLHSQGQLWRQHDGTRLDLSNFTTLKSITLSAMCMCAPLSRDISRDGLFKLLPRSVEKFTLQFPPSIGIFYSTRDGKVIVEEYSQFLFHGVGPSQSRWIEELALHNATRLPNLHQVSLLEDQKGQGGEEYAIQNWLEPSWIKAAFEEAHVHLSVSLRKNRND